MTPARRTAESAEVQISREARAQLALTVVVLTLVISCWFAAAAALPSLTAAVQLTGRDQLLLIVVVQVGFALGAIVFGMAALADRFRPERLLPVASVATAIATVTPTLGSANFTVLWLSRFLVGICLAAVYPTGMRLALSWTGSRHRGLAVGSVVAALTVGTAMPQLLIASPLRHWQLVLAAAGLAALLGGGLSLALRSGPHLSALGQVSLREATALLRDPMQRKISISYLGHMWEVYGLWVWLPTFLLTMTVFARWSPGERGLLTFVLIGVGGAAGCLVSGLLSMPHGKRVVARASVAVSGVCALLSPFLTTAPLAVVIALLLIWNAAAIADSPLFSAMTGDEAHGRPVGAALALQMGTGYLVSAAAIMATVALADQIGWRWAMPILALGPAVATAGLAPWRRPA